MSKRKKTVRKDTKFIDEQIENVDKLEKKIDSMKLGKKESEFPLFQELVKTAQLISATEDFNKLLQHIVDSAIRITRAESGFIMLLDNYGRLEFKVARNLKKEELEIGKFRISRSVVNQVARTGASIFLTDVYQDDRFRSKESIVDLGLKMVMCVPLKIKARLLGLIYVDACSKAEACSNLERKILEAFASLISISVENARLYESDTHDSLTDLYSLSYLNRRLDEEVFLTMRHKRSVISLLVMDVNNFRTIIEPYGHEFGNAVLIRIGEIIQSTIRESDIPARSSSDTFYILLPETDSYDARRIAEKLIREINKKQILIYNKIPIDITISIGISTFPAERVEDSSRIIMEAEYALSLSKKKGVNIVSSFAHKDVAEEIDNEFVGESESVEKIRNELYRAAHTEATVLIYGETGTGKELIARLIHQESQRRDKPFVVLNCGTIPENLLESELFGHEKGSFTGAYREQKGKFEIANGGTVFLDEIGDLPLHSQVKILRVIENKEIDKIGSKKPVRTDVRIIAATNKDLKEKIKKKKFREDLFYRLNVIDVFIPPLRKRTKDIDPIARYFLKKLNKKYAKKFKGFTKDCLSLMKSYHWPGNVREIIHRLERAVIMCTSDYIDSDDIGLTLAQVVQTREISDEREPIVKKIIYNVLHRYKNNLTKASNELGISRMTLRSLMKKYGVSGV